MSRKTVQHRYFTEEKWAEVNKENKQLYDEFFVYCRSTDKSPDTIESYASNLRIWFLWMLDYANNKRFYDITKRDIMNFQDWMMNKQGLSSNRVRQLKSSVSSMSNFIVDMLDKEYPDFKNIVNKIKPPAKQSVREKTVLSNEQVEELLKKLVDMKKYQQACLLACLAGSGVRKGEIIQFKVNFFDDSRYDEESGFYVTAEIRTKGAGRAGKIMSKFVIKDIIYPYLQLWLKQREELGINCEELFVSKYGGETKPASKDTVDSFMLTFSKLTGLDIYCHAFRHYAATWLKKNGVEISKIRDFLGHNDSSTTEIYIDIGKEDNLKDMLGFMKKIKVEEVIEDIDEKDED